MCNLRCRICAASVSVTLNTEGEFYEKEYNLKNTRYTHELKKQNGFSKEQIQEIFNLSRNLRKLEFYGGEPLLDIPTLELLQKLVDSGQSKNITLFYNTNGVVKPSSKHYNLWNNFKSIEFNLSFDDIGERFTYQRHPALWSDAVDNLNELRNFKWDIPVHYRIICTLSVFNVYYLNEILAEFDKLKLLVFINTLHNPDYYDIRFLPKEIKLKIHDHLGNEFSQTAFVKNMLIQDGFENLWDTFKFWTNVKDKYRNESFKKTFSEFYKILNDYDNTF